MYSNYNIFYITQFTYFIVSLINKLTVIQLLNIINGISIQIGNVICSSKYYPVQIYSFSVV